MGRKFYSIKRRILILKETSATIIKRCHRWFRFAALVAPLFFTGCLGKPAGVNPVSRFDIDRYLGTWYEIARLDHSFEKGLEKVTAEYALGPDGGITVINRGYSPDRDEWKEARGIAHFTGDTDQGYLKVSFFWPFYGSYVIFELDEENYQYAFISGPTNSYLWLLARTPTVSETLKKKFEQRISALGFAGDELIWVKQ